MGIALYSSRNAAPCKELKYNIINQECKTQIVNIMNRFFEKNQLSEYAEEYIWPMIQEILKDEHGTNSLYREDVHRTFGGYIAASAEVTGYLTDVIDHDKLLDTIELIFTVIVNCEKTVLEDGYRLQSYTPAQVIEDLNTRFAQHCIGYKFEGRMLVRIDNELLYSTITKELMTFLSNPNYHNINEEYMQAHKHFRSGDYKDCVVNCAKAFESTLKVICDKKGYAFKPTDTAAPLLSILYNQNFIPTYLQTNLTGLRSILGDGVTVIRNKTSAHGAGTAVIDVNEGLAAFALNSAGSTIKFLLTLLEGK